MSSNVSAQSALVSALGVLIQRRSNTADAAEKQAINDAIAKINADIDELEQASLLDAALIVSSAADGLEDVVATARLGPFDRYLSDVQMAIDRLRAEQARIHAVDKLAPAPAPATASAPAAAGAPASPGPGGGAQAPAAAAALQPIRSTEYAQLQPEYRAWYDAMQVRPGREANVAYYVNRLAKFRHVYEAVADPLAIPWYFVGILHAMECGFNFGTHLHNGDPLGERTVHVPKGRPPTGAPPFDWRDSARDALMLKGYQHESDWSVPRTLFLFEKFNGFGYRPLNVPTPYLWSFSDRYDKGKFVADHEFQADAVSGQCGAALMLKGIGIA